MELSEQDIARGVCEHGLLKRSCEICELNKEIESLISENEDLKLKLKRYEMDLKGIVLVSSELYDMSKSALRKDQ